MALGRYRLTAPHMIDHVMREPGYEFVIDAQTGDWMVTELHLAERIDSAQAMPPRPDPKPQRFDPPPRPAFKCCGWRT